MADDATAATSLGRGSWVYRDEGLGADATALPIGESSHYWRLHQQASRVEAKEVTEEDLPIRPARIPTTQAGGEEFVVMCEDFWELPELQQFPSMLPEDTESQQVPFVTEKPTPAASSEAVEATASDEVTVQAEQVAALPTATVAATPTGASEQMKAAPSEKEPGQAAAPALEIESAAFVTAGRQEEVVPTEPAPTTPVSPALTPSSQPSEAERVIELTKSLFTPVLKDLQATLIEPLVQELAAVRPDVGRSGHNKEHNGKHRGHKDSPRECPSSQQESKGSRKSKDHHGPKDNSREHSASRQEAKDEKSRGRQAHKDSSCEHSATQREDKDRMAAETTRDNRRDAGPPGKRGCLSCQEAPQGLNGLNDWEGECNGFWWPSYFFGMIIYWGYNFIMSVMCAVEFLGLGCLNCFSH